MSNIMHPLKYTDYPEGRRYDSGVVREYLRKVSEYSCAYCTITESESPGAAFHVDHFRPQKKFPDLRDICTNLRYSCPRCNLMKSDFWITEEAGCIRDCTKCHTKLCLENISRLVDSYNENPTDYFNLQEDLIIPLNGSKAAEHTIKCLRLNRPQLLKLRRVRRFLDLWKEELKKKHEDAKNILDDIASRKTSFDQNFDIIDQAYLPVIQLLFEMLTLQATYNLEFIEHEQNNLNRLLEYQSGADDIIK